MLLVGRKPTVSFNSKIAMRFNRAGIPAHNHTQKNLFFLKLKAAFCLEGGALYTTRYVPGIIPIRQPQGIIPLVQSISLFC